MARSPGPWVDMLLSAWRTSLGHRAFVTSTVADIVGSAACPFREWVANHADAFRRRSAGGEA